MSNTHQKYLYTKHTVMWRRSKIIFHGQALRLKYLVIRSNCDVVLNLDSVTSFSKKGTFAHIENICNNNNLWVSAVFWDTVKHRILDGLTFKNSYMKIFIARSKMNVYRKGNWACIAKGQSALCPVKNLKRYLKKKIRAVYISVNKKQQKPSEKSFKEEKPVIY